MGRSASREPRFLVWVLLLVAMVGCASDRADNEQARSGDSGLDVPPQAQDIDTAVLDAPGTDVASLDTGGVDATGDPSDDVPSDDMPGPPPTTCSFFCQGFYECLLEICTPNVLDSERGFLDSCIGNCEVNPDVYAAFFVMECADMNTFMCATNPDILIGCDCSR